MCIYRMYQNWLFNNVSIHFTMTFQTHISCLTTVIQTISGVPFKAMHHKVWHSSQKKKRKNSQTSNICTTLNCMIICHNDMPLGLSIWHQASLLGCNFSCFSSRANIKKSLFSQKIHTCNISKSDGKVTQRYPFPAVVNLQCAGILLPCWLSRKDSCGVPVFDVFWCMRYTFQVLWSTE